MPNQYVNKVQQSNGTVLIDITDTTAVASDVASGKYFYLATGEKVEGTGSGGSPSATQHTIYFEFSDSTNTTITAYWDDSFISNSITATTPTTYGGKTVTLAQLDGVTWYSHDPSWETLYDGIPDFYTDAGNYFWIASLANVHPTVGSEWRLTIDGTVYYSTAKQSGVNVVIGNPINCGGTDDGSNVPVAFYNYNGTGWAGDTLTFTTGGHSVKIERKIS